MLGTSRWKTAISSSGPRRQHPFQIENIQLAPERELHERVRMEVGRVGDGSLLEETRTQCASRWSAISSRDRSNQKPISKKERLEAPSCLPLVDSVDPRLTPPKKGLDTSRPSHGSALSARKLLTFYCSPNLRNGSFAAGIALPRATLLELICYTPMPLSETPLAEGLTTQTGERRSCVSPRAIQWVGLSDGGPRTGPEFKPRLRNCNELQGPETLRPQSAWVSL